MFVCDGILNDGSPVIDRGLGSTCFFPAFCSVGNVVLCGDISTSVDLSYEGR